MSSIAIIDDVKSNRQILGKIIETIDPNICIHNFDSAELALGWINSHTPDLVITDYKMPGLDGVEFTTKFRSNSRSQNIPVLMITMADDLVLPIRARVAGATAFLQRPVDYDLVRARIRSLLTLHGNRNRLRLIVDNSHSHSPA
jgi:DNA-binding response OmpR family regulator